MTSIAEITGSVTMMNPVIFDHATTVKSQVLDGMIDVGKKSSNIAYHPGASTLAVMVTMPIHVFPEGEA